MLSSLLNLLFPFQCCGCRRYGAPLCSACARTPLARNTEQLPGIFAPFSYQDPRVQTLIHRFKYQGEWALAPFLARWMAEALRESLSHCEVADGDRSNLTRGVIMSLLKDHTREELPRFARDDLRDQDCFVGRSPAACLDGKAGGRPPRNDSSRTTSPFVVPGHTPVLVPIPLHPSRMAERGYNQSEKLANALSRELKIPIAHALKRVRTGTQQALLSKEARQQNIRGAFHLAHPLKAPSFILLVDDVVTTGATLSAAASAFPPDTPLLSLTFAHQALQHIP